MSEGMDNPWRRVVRVWLPLLLLLLAFGLRLVRLDAFRLWGDEGWSMSVTTLDPASLLVEVGHDIHPPLYYYMAHLWGQVAGWGVFASRFFSVFPGTLLVALTAALGRRFGGTRIGWTGAALLAVAPFAVYYSQEVRPFAWMALWCVSALYLLLRVVHPRTDAGTRSAVTPLAHGHCEPAPFPAKQSPMPSREPSVSLAVVHPRTDAGTPPAVTPLAHGHCEPAPFPAKQSPMRREGPRLSSAAIGSGRRAVWVGYGVLSLLAAYTSYSTAFWFAAHGALLLLRRDWRRRFLPWLLVEGVVLLLAVPWLLAYGGTTGAHLAGQGTFTGRESLPIWALVGRSLSGLIAGVTLPERVSGALAAAAGVVAVTGALLAAVCASRSTCTDAGGPSSRRAPNATLPRRADGQGAPCPDKPGIAEGSFTAVWVWGAMALLPILALYPVHLVYPWFEARVVAFCVAPVCLCLAACLHGWRASGRWGPIVASGLTVLALLPGLYDYVMRYERYDPVMEDYFPLIEHVAAHTSRGDCVLYNASWHVGYFASYYRGPALDYARFSLDAVERATECPRQVWVVLRDIVRQPGGARVEDRVEDALSTRASKVSEAWYGRIRLARYAVGPVEAREQQVDLGLGPAERAAPSVWLRAASIGSGGIAGATVAPGEAIYVTLTWEAAQPIARSYHVSVQLVGPHNPARGSPVWAQHDGVPGNQERPTTGWAPGEQVVDRRAMWVDPGAPEGAYTLQVSLYDPLTGDRLRVVEGDGDGADAIVLSQVHLVAP